MHHRGAVDWSLDSGDRKHGSTNEQQTKIHHVSQCRIDLTYIAT